MPLIGRIASAAARGYGLFANIVQAAVDPYFNYVVALLHGDGTNGGQNNTFLDSSTNNFTITRNGNTTQGSFSPFSQTGWSNYFDGSSLLTFASSANYVPGSGEFCLECWFMPTSTGTDRWLIGNRNNNYVPFAIVYTGSSAPTALLFYMSSNGSTWDVINGGYAYGVVANRWNHLALVRSGTSIIAYINGIGTTLATSSANFSTAQPFYVGGSPAAGDPEFVGYISNVRFVKGSTPYSGSTITVPTTPLTAITNTQLLTSQSNRFLDNSTNAVTPSITGSPSVQPFSPFNPTTAYSASSIGGSGYFDGSGDYLTVPDSTAFTMGTGDFSVECWYYGTSSSRQIIVSQSNNGGTTFSFWLEKNASNQLRCLATVGGVQYVATATATMDLNAWNFLQLVKSGTTLYGYQNGTQVCSVSVGSGSLLDSTDNVTIGDYGAGSGLPVVGYISSVRILKGTASTATVPTSPLTAITNTSLLLNYTNGAIFDNAAVADYETVDNVQISTSVKKYGTGSLAFDGTGDYLPATNKTLFDIGGEDFTAECWVNFNSFPATYQAIFSKYGADYQYQFLWDGANSRWFWNVNSTVSGNTTVTFSDSLSTGVWYHIALVRIGTSYKVYKNGTQVGTTQTISGNINAGTRPFTLGCTFGGTNSPLYYLNGYIDDFRFTKSIVRYPYNFTPPTAAFPDIGGTVTLTADPYYEYTTLLLPGNGTNGAQNNTFLDSSTNAFTITRNGNTTQGAFSPFSQTGWSLGGCTGTSDYLQMGSNAGLQLGTGDFTVECWAYFTTVGSSGGSENVIMDVRPTGTNGAYFNFGLSNQTVYWDNGTGSYPLVSPTIPLNAWLHIAIVRSSGTSRLYINGTSVASVSDSVNYSCGSTNRIANLSYFSSGDRKFNGSISNLRIVKGTAVYTGNFTQPIAPLTAISGTTLLTLQSNRWIDNSSSAIAISVNGNPSVQAFSPFNPTASWSAATYGGSGYFDGSGDYLTTTGTSSFNPSTGNWTFEAWCYFNNASNNDILVNGTASGADKFYILWVSSTFYLGDATSNTIVVSSSKPLNQWFHIAVVKNGSTYTAYLNGVSIGTSTTALASSAITTFEIGARTSQSWFTSGYIANFRYSQSAIYTTTFTPPTSPVTGGALLLNYTNAGIYDATSKNDLETVGNAQISTTQSKFGGSSMYFDGAGDYLVGPWNSLTDLGAGDFTIEFWMYPTAVGQSSVTYLFYIGTSGNYAPILIGQAASGYGIVLYSSSTGSSWNLASGSSFGTATANAWNHVALTRYGADVRLFLNGAVGTTLNWGTTALLTGSSHKPNIGSATGVANTYYTGYMQDLRVTKGIARYTSNFTPPTTAFLTL